MQTVWLCQRRDQRMGPILGQGEQWMENIRHIFLMAVSFIFHLHTEKVFFIYSLRTHARRNTATLVVGSIAVAEASIVCAASC